LIFLDGTFTSSEADIDDMDAEEAIETGGLAAFFLFTALFLSTIDFSLGGSPNTVETANKLSRFLYAGVMNQDHPQGVRWPTIMALMNV
jgi:hypothetical protein